MTPTLTLTTRWNPSATPPALELTLCNAGSGTLADVRLGFSGPAIGIAPDTRLENAELVSHLSNHVLVAPPAGLALAPGAEWRLVLHGMTHPLRHWTDGATGAYALADGQLLDVAIVLDAGDARPRRGAARLTPPAEPEDRLSIIPWPGAVATDGARATPSGLDLRPHEPMAERAAAAFGTLVADLFPDEGLLRASAEGGMVVRFRTEAGLGAEAYELVFDGEGAAIAAATQTGFLYGLITLGQILRGSRQHPGRFVVPARGMIADEPALGWRGTHFDSARRFFPAADVARFLKIIAWNKMNRFHWHLSDDEGWRVEIDAFPALTQAGAWRAHDLAVPPLLGGGGAPEGGFYNKAAIREIVTLGQSLGIAIVPEIDVPGHCFAALEALPQLRDPDETAGAYRSVQGFPDNCLNPAREPVYRFLETVIDEMLELFPAGIFHLGADEVPLAAWSGSPLALALLEKLDGADAAKRHRARAGVVSGHEEAEAIEGTGAAVLQAHFIARVHGYLRARGVVTGGWEEAGHGGALDRSASYLVGWRNREASAALAARGHDIVVAPGQHYYLDMANGPDWTEPGAGWAGSSGPEQTYGFDPRAGWTAEQLTHLLGVQSCIWSERLADPAVFDRLVFPRLSAVAETAWTRPGRKSWARFSASAGLMPIMYGHWADPD